MNLFNFHPAYGLENETRMKILEDAELFGVKEAAKMNRVSESAIQKWRKRLRDTSGGNDG